ncbi:MAG: epoxide hydrolase family protein [Candidatus Dormibacteraceae bacterium]
MSGLPLRVTEERMVLDPGALLDLRERLAHSRLPPPLGDGWAAGAPGGWLSELIEEWRAFDVGALQDRLDRLTHLRADIDGQSLHLVHAPGRGPNAVPLLLTHGWPGSFLEYLAVLPRLSDPGGDGGDASRTFSVVIPSLPGFGFSGPPPAQGLPPRRVAGLWHRLMAEGLGYQRYVAHGSDLGAGVTAWLARDHPQEVAGIHLATPGLSVAPGPRTPEEDAYAAGSEAWEAEEGGYEHEHATKPATLGAALSDSPAGLAAWIGEKVVAWSSTRRDGSPAFDRSLLLATLTLYWATETITSSLLPYWAYRHLPGAGQPADDPPPVPTAISIFGGESVPFPKPPRALAERYYRVTAWAEHPVGGHFPAVAEPELFVRTIGDTLHPRLAAG